MALLTDEQRERVWLAARAARAGSLVIPEPTEAEVAADLAAQPEVEEPEEPYRAPNCATPDHIVRAIRASTQSGASLARKYGCSKNTIVNIRTGRTRRNVT